MDELTPRYSTHDSYTVGWICALDVELAASMVMLDYELPSLPQAEGDANTYILGRIGQHNIVLTCLPSGTTGTNAAANAATNMLRSFPNIRYCLMVGIGGGAPSVPNDDPCKDIRLGDVVVSCPSASSGGVLQYDFGKTMSEGSFVQTGVLNKTSIVLSNTVSALRARHRIEGSRIPQFVSHMLDSNRMMQRDYSHPGLEHDQLFRADFEHLTGEPTCHSCDTKALVPRKLRENANPVIHYGLIGSANQVMRHGVTRDRLRNEKNIICFEMEAAGLMDIFPCLVIRGICDYADSHKNKRWQPYAAVTAAACAKEVLLATPTPEVLVKTSFNWESIYSMLQATLYELKWDQLLNLLPISDYTRHEHLEIPTDCDDPKFYWTLRNIDFERWKQNEGPRVLCLTGHPSEDNLSQLSSYIMGQEKAAGYSVLPLFCSNMIVGKTVATFLQNFLLELIYCSPETQRTPITRSFFNNLLESPNARDQNWKEEELNEEVFLKYMKIIFKSTATNDLLNSLKATFTFERRRRLLIVISNLDAIESPIEATGYILPLINHIQQQIPNVKMLLTSTTQFGIEHFQDFLLIEFDKERKECLRSLQFDNTRYAKISEEYEGSCEWIWTHNEYENWSASDSSRLLYIQGKPGSGKSTLMKYFNRNLLFKDLAAHQAIVARFFYSFRDGELQRSHYSMLLSILYEILHQDESFFYHRCQTEFRAYQRYGTHLKWNYDSLKRMLQSLQDYRTTKRIYLTIDAIDESDEGDRRETLGLLLELCSKMKHSVVKIFMASRPVAQLEARRDQFHHNFIKLDDQTKRDIYNYAQSQLYGLKSTDLLAQATAYILENAQGVFLWVKLISEQLIEAHEQGHSEKEIIELLKQLPTELEDFYCLMLEKMKQNRSALLYATNMFRFILFARRPLTVDELLHALGILKSVDSSSGFVPSDTSFETCIPLSERIILSSGGNFLEIRKHNGHKIVQIIHQTVREFFLNPNGLVANSVFEICEAHAHIDIATTCIRYLSVCATSTSLMGKLPKVNYWDAAQYQQYCQYLNRRPLATYALDYTKSHVDICKHNANIEYVTSQLIEQLTDGSAGASLLRNWATTGLRQGSLSRNNTEDTSATSFLCEILRCSSTYGFHIAAELGLLLETDPNNQDEDGRTPLSLAAGNGHEAIVRLLINKDASIYIKDNKGQAPLSVAAINGHLDIVIWLSDYGDFIDQGDHYHVTPLSRAAEHGHLDVARFLVEKGAKIDYNDGSRTPLSWAAEHGHLNVVRFLVEKGAKMECMVGRQTPLLRAVTYGHLDVVRFLVEKGAKIEYMVAHQTPLLWAVTYGHLDVAGFLIEKGAKMEHMDGRKTPLLWAAGHGHLTVVKFLVEKGAEINYDDGHQTPLSSAVTRGHLDIVKYLVRKGANTEFKDYYGRTIISQAVNINRLDIVKFLIEMC